MLYTRSDIVDLCSELAPGQESLILSCIWHLSRGDPNCIGNQKFGLLQLSLEDARKLGCDSKSDLFDARTNLELGIKLLNERGLLAFLGREFAGHYRSILELAGFLAATPRSVADLPQSK